MRCTPRAQRDELAGWHDGVLQARVRAAPHDGAANRALIRLIADTAGVRVANVDVVRGGRSRDKLVAVDGIDRGRLLAALGAPAPDGAAG